MARSTKQAFILNSEILVIVQHLLDKRERQLLKDEEEEISIDGKGTCLTTVNMKCVSIEPVDIKTKYLWE